MIRPDEIGDILHETFRFRFDVVTKVRSVERLREYDGVVHDEIRHDIGFDSWIGGSGESDERNVGKISFERTHLLVIGTYRKRSRNDISSRILEHASRAERNEETYGSRDPMKRYNELHRERNELVDLDDEDPTRYF
jgi:hypothetical protein